MSSISSRDNHVTMSLKEYIHFSKRINGDRTPSSNKRISSTAKRVAKIDSISINGSKIGRTNGRGI